MDNGPLITADLDSEPQTEAESDFESTQDEQGPTQTQFVGTSFRAGRDITVSGSRSITNIYQMAPGTPPSDFRKIPIGDLDLRNEIRLVASGEVYRQDGRRSVRRMYSARIYGSKSKMTAVVYQGENAEEEWRENISRYSGLRHPNLMQLFGMASACGMHAAIFNDELIPMQQLLEKYSGSPLRMVHLFNFRDIEFEGANNYIASVLGSYLDSTYCTMWIRPSTGRLCVDPTDRAYRSALIYDLDLTWDASFSSNLSVLEAPEDSKIVDSISLDRYHAICSFHFENYHQLSISTNASVQLGMVILCPPGSELEHPNEIAYIPDPEVTDSGWEVARGASRTVLENGWTRVDSSEALDGNIYRHIYFEDRFLSKRVWLAQANLIFLRRGITSNHNDYVLVGSIGYTLTLTISDSIPPGYLFLCPLADLQAESPLCFRLPECPAYWALDSTGDERLSMEEAEQLGFPTFELETEVYGSSWDENVYSGIRQFHQAKGFDPDSQDIAGELGYRLYKISAELDVEETDLDDYQPETQEAQASELPQEPVHGESGMPDQPLVTSSSAAAHPMVSFGTYAQGTAIEESFDPHLFGSAAPTARSSHNFNFEFPFHDQPYHLPPLEHSTPIQFAPLAIAGSSTNYSGPSRTQLRTPPPSLWTSFPRLPPIPAPSSPSRLPNPITAYLDHLPTSGSGKRKSQDDEPAADIIIHARRPRKMPKRADLWGVLFSTT